MKGGGVDDEEEYGSYYASSRPLPPSSTRLYARTHSPSRHSTQQPSVPSDLNSPYSKPHPHPSQHSALGQSQLGSQLGQGQMGGQLGQGQMGGRQGYSNRYGGNGGRSGGGGDYHLPPCCHQYYTHLSPTHFNTIPHPPLQYRDAPSCSTLSRTCYSSGRRSQGGGGGGGGGGVNNINGPYASYYSSSESPYGEAQIYYTSSTLNRGRYGGGRSMGEGALHIPPHLDTPTKLYDPPPPPLPYANMREGGVSRYGSGLLRNNDESRLYSTSAQHLVSNPSSSIPPRIPSPLHHHHHHYIDRSISLIRLDNSNNTPSSSQQQQQNSDSNNSTISRLPSDSLSLSQQQGQCQSSSLVPTPAKSKFKIIMDSSSSNPPSSSHPHPPQKILMVDKGVMTSSSSSSGNEAGGSSSGAYGDGRRVSIGGTTPPGASNLPSALSGGVPDLLPTTLREGTGNPWRGGGGCSSSVSPRRNLALGGPCSSRGLNKAGGSSHAHLPPMPNFPPPSPTLPSRWQGVKNYVREETSTFFGLSDGPTQNLKEIWLCRRKRFACRRYSERNVDSMPPPSPYQPIAHEPHFEPRLNPIGRPRRGRTRKKECVFVIYFNLLRWLFWSIRFGRAGVRVSSGPGCGSDIPPSGSSTPGRVCLSSRSSRDRTKSRSFSPSSLSDLSSSSLLTTELFFDEEGESNRNSGLHLQPPGRGLHWRIGRVHPVSMSNRISPSILSRVLDNSTRQTTKRGFNSSSRRKVGVSEEYEDFRPYFTYWVSLVHILVLITSMITYGLAPIGIDLHRKSALVLVTSLSLQQMEIVQPANFWIGPSATDLIHLGAKYAPCMRRDEKIYRRIIETRDQERQTACCIRNDNSGCVQSSRNECSIKGVSRTGLLSTWKKWTGKEVPGGRISGSVCGLDPKFCEAPASIAPYEWPDDITKWPICRKTRELSGMTNKDKTAEHMVCEVIGHPCCIGIHAKCVITTREYCRFVSGYFHEEASLCSQVSCLQDVCGMFPFLGYESPDQFYRLFSSLFLHAGLGHILMTLFFHWFILRDVEKLAGPLRTAIIYLGSGIAANLASVLIQPTRAEVGPGGCLFGVLACLLVELVHMWGMMRRPWTAFGKTLLVCTLLLLVGFLPWVDNFAHAAGFGVGFLLTHALMPYIAFGNYSTYRKWVEVVVCIASYLGTLVALLIVFYAGFGHCEFCSLLNCLPLTQDFCADQEIDLKPAGGGINLIT